MAEERVEAVERALSILDCFDGEAESLSLAELARGTGFYKSTILRLAASLERFGYLVRQDDGRFRLGASLWRLGSLYRRGFALAEHVRPELRRLVDATGETASYYVRDGDSRVCLYRLNSPRAARHHLTEGQRLRLDAGATAKVLTAFSNPRTNGEVRAAGHAISIGERDPDVAAVAVPVLDADGRLRGALSVSGLVGRFDDAARTAALAALRDSADRLGRQIAAD